MLQLVFESLMSVVLDIRFQLFFGVIAFFHFHNRLPRFRRSTNKKSVFITGCDSGMGHRMALHFDSLGMRVFAGCLRPEGEGARSLREAASYKLHVVPLDITSEEAVLAAVEYVKKNIPEEEGGLYCLINNAGILSYVHFEIMTTGMCEDIISTNVIGTIRVTRHFLPLIQKTKGRIITISSILARLTFPKVSVYTATKCALNGFFNSLKYEMLDQGVHVAIIEPADFSTTTDIMQWTRRNLDAIWSNMTPEEQISKLHLYNECKERVSRNQKTSIAEQENNYKYLLIDAEDAMLAEEPNSIYVSAPKIVRIALSVLRCLPEKWVVNYILKKISH